MQKTTAVMLISVVIVLSSVIYIALDQQKKNNATDRASMAFVAPVIRQVMTVDMARTNLFTPELVSSGQLPILAIHRGPDPSDYSQDMLGFLDSMGRLTSLDLTNDDRIDMNDPIFSQLELVYLHGNKIVRVVPLADAGVRQIFLDRSHMTPEELYPNGPRGYWRVENSVILADGTKRSMRVVPMNASDLPNLVFNKRVFSVRD
jgi:hypothetical protein